MSYSQPCIRCRFKAVKPHIPPFDAEALLRSGTGVLSPEISSGLQTGISSLERELSVIDELFHEISSRRESVRKALNCHKAAFAPIRTLLLDILLEIFAKVPTNALRRDYAPWVIGQVCSLWRTISLSTPSLWSDICFDIYHAATGDQKLQALTMILSRSGDHPLTISIDSPSDGFHFPHNCASAGDLRILAVHGSRWTSLELNMNRTDLHNAFDVIDRSNMPLTCLRHLHISTTEGSASLNTPIFSPSPILYCILQGISIMTLPVPLDNLATLTSELEHLSELPYLLRMVTELEVLRIIPLTNSMPTYEYDGPMVTNTSLHRLSIQCIPWAQRYTLPRAPLNFSRISLPGLLELDLETGAMHDTGREPFTPEDILQLCHMLEQSRCHLKILRVDSPIHFSAISPLLVSHGQSLTTVHLFVDEDNVFGLIRGLNAQGDMPGTLIPAANALLPSLRCLTLTEVPPEAGFGMLRECEALFQTAMSHIINEDVQKLSTLRLVLFGVTLDRLQGEPNTSSALLHLVGLQQIGSGLIVSLIVDGKDILRNDTWLRILGPQ